MISELTKDKESEYKRISEWLKKMLPNDYDKFDLKAHFDSTLSYVENKENIREQLRGLIKDSLKDQVDAIKDYEERLLDEKKQEAETKAKEYNKNIKYEKTDIDAYYAEVFRGVDKVCKGYSNLLFVRGPPAQGKSYSIRRVLIENGTDYVDVSGEVTDAYLYRLLYENNGKVIWFKDVGNLLDGGSKTINLLKAATETEEDRLLTKSSYSKQQADLPDSFLCTCRFIFDYNSISNKHRDDFEALVSRGDFVEFSLNSAEMKHVMTLIAKTPEELEVTNYLLNNFKSGDLIRLNLRSQWKALKTYHYAISLGLDWRKEITNELNRKTETESLLYNLIGINAVRRVELKKLLLKHKYVNSIRSAENKINEWIFTDQLYVWSSDERNGLVSIVKKEENLLEVENHGC